SGAPHRMVEGLRHPLPRRADPLRGLRRPRRAVPPRCRGDVVALRRPPGRVAQARPARGEARRPDKHRRGEHGRARRDPARPHPGHPAPAGGRGDRLPGLIGDDPQRGRPHRRPQRRRARAARAGLGGGERRGPPRRPGPVPQPRRGRDPPGRYRQRPLHHGSAPFAGAAPPPGPRPHRRPPGGHPPTPEQDRAMNSLLPFIVVGLATGAIYGLAGVGLVLTYRTSGVFNFAHGAIASAGAYLFYELHNKHGVPWPVAVFAGVFLLGPALGVVLELIGRRLAGQSAALRVVATVGLLLMILGLATIVYGPAVITLPQFLPTTTFRVTGVNVGYDQMILVVVGIVTSLGLTLILRKTRLGMAMRGVVDDPALLELTGLGATGVRRAAWIIGSMVASAS